MTPEPDPVIVPEPDMPEAPPPPETTIPAGWRMPKTGGTFTLDPETGALTPTE